MGLLTNDTQQITISTADFDMATYFNCGIARVMTAQADGTVYLKRAGDAAFISHVLLKGVAIYGKFTAIGGSVTGSTSGLVLNLEV
jgi:hypothetical protein